MISGREALASMEQAIAGARNEESGLDATLASATAEAGRLRAAQADAYRALARIRLGEISGGEVVHRLEATERRALELMERTRKTVEALTVRRGEAAARLAEAEQARQATSATLEKIADEIDALTARTEARVASDPAWASAKQRAERAAGIAEESDRKADQAEADREEKRKPYEADPLFMYLWKRGFGTAAYRAGNVVRFFDRKVAALVGYSEARPNYAMLNEIPLRLREHANRRLSEIEAAKSDLAAIERRALEADGIKALEARQDAARAELAKRDQAVEAARAALAEIDESHAAAVDPNRDTGFREAVDLIADDLSREDLKNLYQEALATPDRRDEAIVGRIEELNGAIAKADREVEEIRGQAMELARRRTELETVRDDFRRKGYDHPDVVFGNDRMIGEIIGGVIGGVLRSPDLWRVLTQGYGRRPRRSDPVFGGGPRFPMPGPFGGGGEWDRGDSGGFGGGSRGGGGGGFSTGGGF